MLMTLRYTVQTDSTRVGVVPNRPFGDWMRPAVARELAAAIIAAADFLEGKPLRFTPISIFEG